MPVVQGMHSDHGKNQVSGFMQPSRFYIGLIGFFLAALVFAAMYFVTGMNDASYLVNDGAGYGLRYIDKPSYDANQQGLVFVISFLVAGLLLLLLIVLPDQEGVFASVQPAPPQPRRRPASQQPTQAPAPQPVAMAQPAAAPTGGTPVEEPTQALDVEAEAPGVEADAAPVQSPSLDDEVATAVIEDELEIEDLPESRYDDTGDEDVVYGNGRVTDDSIWDFIHAYPDSTVKFLYRKSLENKPLTPNEEDIYRKWEMRGMSRARVRQFVLEIMGWKSLPDDYPHNIWRELRDKIFDLKERMVS